MGTNQIQPARVYRPTLNNQIQSTRIYRPTPTKTNQYQSLDTNNKQSASFFCSQKNQLQKTNQSDQVQQSLEKTPFPVH